jgi:hypothetical protein
LSAPANFPFHPEAGIQTSNWIFESAVGWIDPATRQNAGRLEKAVPSGAVYGPAGTETAIVMVVSGREKFANPSQVDAASRRPMPIKLTART